MAEYNGTIELISGITPKNNGTFPLVNAKDVLMPDGSRLNQLEPATAEQISEAVDTWLKDHPEATTTVEDGSISEEKLTPELLQKIEIGSSCGGLNVTASELLITILRNGVYAADQSTNITALAEALAATEEEEPDTPVDPDGPEVTLTSISATYSGGNVPVGTAVTALTGIVVTAHYSDGSTETVTDYTLSGTIAAGSNTITVSYGGKTTTFSVTGVTNNNLLSGMYQVGLLTSSGGLNTASTSAYTSDYMECAGMESIYILIQKNAQTNMQHYYRALAFYDGDKNAISGLYTGITPTENIEPITVPTGAVYCRVTFAGIYAPLGTLLYVGENIPEDTTQFVAFTAVIE